MTARVTPPICDYEGSDYQQTFWDTGKRKYEDQVEAIALKRLLPEKGDLLLEIGAGAGRNTPRYQGYSKIVLLDYSLSQLQLAQSRLGRNQRFIYVVGDAYRLPFGAGIFDAATMIRTLHHLQDAPLAIQEARRVLRQGGFFILEYANKHNLKAILRYGLGKQAWNPFDESPIEFAELNFDFHPQSICHWLETTGFKVQRQLTVSHFRLNLLKKIIPTSWLVGMDSLAQWTGDWWQLSPSVFLRAEAIGESPIQSQSVIFACPQCGSSSFVESENALKCQGCGRIWEIRDGIYIFK